jgi:hypothetical protein
MKAHHLGAELLDKRAERLIERPARRLGAGGGKIDAQLARIGPKPFAPARRARRIGRGRRMAEEIEIERRLRGGAARPPARAAAIAMSTPAAPAIGASRTGASILRSEVMR